MLHAKVKGSAAAEVIGDQGWIENEFIPTVQKRGAAIIEARGASSAASAANAAVNHVHDWLLGTPDGDWVSMAIPSDGTYGIEEGIFCGYPCTCAGGEYTVVEGLEIDDFSRSRIDVNRWNSSPIGDPRGAGRPPPGETRESDEKPCPGLRKWISSTPPAGHDTRRVALKSKGRYRTGSRTLVPAATSSQGRTS